MREIEFRGVKIRLPNNLCKQNINTPTHIRFIEQTYGQEEIDKILPYINNESIVLDLGGSVGGLACVVNDKMNDKENMVVVEANPNLINVLEMNRDIMV
jgi:hypothetical protein